MTSYRLVIVDSDAGYTKALTGYLSEHTGLEVAGTAADGRSACELIEALQPDIVLTSMTLQYLDGLCLLKRVRRMVCPPVMICLMDSCSSATLDVIRRSGADYCVFRTLSIDSIALILTEYAGAAEARARELAELKTLSAETVNRAFVHEVMKALGFSSRYMGSECIAESVALAIESPSILRNMRLGLYPQLAERFNTSPSGVERNMRTAISAANAEGRLSDCIGEEPTNRNCIQYILRQVKTHC